MKNFSKIFLLLLVCNFIQAQDKKVPKVKGEVTVKTNLPPLPNNPDEEDKNIWNPYVADKFNFEITFPAKTKDVWDDEIKQVLIFETYTDRALYRLSFKKLPYVSLNNDQLADLYETVLNDKNNPHNVQEISLKDVYLDGILGKEFIYKEDGRMIFTRYYILDRKLFMLMVNLPENKYTKDFDKWAVKFFESFQIIEK